MITQRELLAGGLAVAGALIIPSSNIVLAGENDDVSPANVGSYCPNANEWALLREVNEWRAANGRPRTPNVAITFCGSTPSCILYVTKR